MQVAKTAFYVVAHADDWQLFMNPNAFNDLIEPDGKVVFIITTAGDAGASELFWRAREEGMKSSVRFCLAPLSIFTERTAIKIFNKHNINCWSVNSVTCYFLRLPDGNLDANGFSINNNQSLLKLRAEQISTIITVDNTERYNSWPDFYTTLKSIIQYESNGAVDICINYLNPDKGLNPNDHPDHIATGHAIQDMSGKPDYPHRLYVGYSVRTGGQKLTGTDLFWKVGMFAAYEKAVLDGAGYSTLNEGIETYTDWCFSTAKFITIT